MKGYEMRKIFLMLILVSFGFSMSPLCAMHGDDARAAVAAGCDRDELFFYDSDTPEEDVAVGPLCENAYESVMLAENTYNPPPRSWHCYESDLRVMDENCNMEATIELWECLIDSTLSKTQRIELVKKCLDNKADINWVEEDISRTPFTPLQYAVQENYADVVALLLQYGANMNIVSPKVRHVLHQVIERDHKEILALLLSYPCDVDFRDKVGCTPLMNAVKEDRVDIADMLLFAGADINATCKVSCRESEAVRTVVEHASSIEMKNFLREWPNRVRATSAKQSEELSHYLPHGVMEIALEYVSPLVLVKEVRL